MRHSIASSLALLALVGGLCASAVAQDREPREARHEPEATRQQPMPSRLDARYGHDHYYPSRGTTLRVVPAGSVRVVQGGANWYFHAGVWFRPAGGQFVVGVPPIGIVVPLLPPAYVTLSIGGIAYYYANDIYYTAAPGGYIVAAPPPGALNVRTLRLLGTVSLIGDAGGGWSADGVPQTQQTRAER